MDNNPDWIEKRLEREYALKEDVNKRSRLCVISESILAASEAMSQRRTTLTVNNFLTVSYMWRITNDYGKS